MDISLWIDSDSLPTKHRQIIIKRIIKEQINTCFVADRQLSDVLAAAEEDVVTKRKPLRDKLSKEELRQIKSVLSMVVVNSGPDSADDYIVNNSNIGSFCITHDIPLAARLVEKGLTVIDDRGTTYTKENIKERLSIRDTMTTLREMGINTDKQTPFDQKTLNKFANSFDLIIQAIKK